eukprot:GSMAST32.ASY1.ANO1.2022.1 assembled CDS
MLSILMRRVALRRSVLFRSSTAMPSFSNYVGKKESRDMEDSTSDENQPHHFRLSNRKHPLNLERREIKELGKDGEPEWKNPTQNHVWTDEELDNVLSDTPKHKPKGFVDNFLRFTVRFAYHGFNFLTGYSRKDPSPSSCEYRLIILESIAGVPGMVAGSVRHFKSLRTLERDHGWIHTLLEEAENERMHLLICLKMFQPGRLVRAAVIGIQVVALPVATLTYIVKPKALHRFVGYLEETAVDTCIMLETLDTPGTKLNAAWKSLPAPAIACSYYNLNDNALWPDVLRCIAADETNHRDVNHTLADMKGHDPNPYIKKHHDDAAKAWRIEKRDSSKSSDT